MNNKKETKMNISIKESMLLRKCINNYMLENKLDYDKSPLFNGLIMSIIFHMVILEVDNKLNKQ